MTGMMDHRYCHASWAVNRFNHSFEAKFDLRQLNLCIFTTYLQDCAESPGDILDNFLFNITADPHETTNLIDTLPELAETLRARIFEIYNTSAASPVWV